MSESVDEIVDQIKRYEPSFDHLQFMKSYLAYKKESSSLIDKYDKLMVMMRDYDASVTVGDRTVTIHTKDGAGKDEIHSYLQSIENDHDIRDNDIVMTNPSSFVQFLSIAV